MKHSLTPHITTLSGIVISLCLMMLFPVGSFAQVEKANKPVRTRSGAHVVPTLTDSVAQPGQSAYQRMPVLDAQGDTVKFEASDSLILA